MSIFFCWSQISLATIHEEGLHGRTTPLPHKVQSDSLTLRRLWASAAGQENDATLIMNCPLKVIFFASSHSCTAGFHICWVHEQRISGNCHYYGKTVQNSKSSVPRGMHWSTFRSCSTHFLAQALSQKSVREPSTVENKRTQKAQKTDMWLDISLQVIQIA